MCKGLKSGGISFYLLDVLNDVYRTMLMQISLIAISKIGTHLLEEHRKLVMCSGLSEGPYTSDNTYL